jgi:hypothetical protein
MNELHGIGIHDTPNQHVFLISKSLQFLLGNKWKNIIANLSKKCKKRKIPKNWDQKFEFFF